MRLKRTTAGITYDRADDKAGSRKNEIYNASKELPRPHDDDRLLHNGDSGCLGAHRIDENPDDLYDAKKEHHI